MNESRQVTRDTGVAGLTMRVISGMNCLPYSATALLARVVPAIIFWQSGRTKVDGFAIKDTTYFLFKEEFALPLIPSDAATILATLAEHVFPVLLILGLATRFSALALLLMTIVIQVFVYPSAYLTHGLWAVALLLIVSQGPGRLSIDHLIAQRYRR